MHRLNDICAVFTDVATGTSQQGFAAEWRAISASIIDGDLIKRSERFDEVDLVAALARFDELSLPRPRLENGASRLIARFQEVFGIRDWDGMAEIFADDICLHDRRQVVGASFVGRDATMANMRASAETGVKNVTSTIMASRGSRLALHRVQISGRDQRPEAFRTDALVITEVDGQDRIIAFAMFDLDETEAAFEELDARYLAGEAADHSHTWSVIANARAALNRGELPAAATDLESVDHRRAVSFAAGEMAPYLRAAFDLEPDFRVYVEVVHRLTDFGAVFTQFGTGTSTHGFEAEWRSIGLVTVAGDLFTRSDLFDEDDLSAALAKFDELGRRAPQPENGASRVCERYRAFFAARDWDAVAEMLADDLHNEDRRRVANAGIRHGRDCMLEDLRAAAHLGIPCFKAIDIATRGERLVLARAESRYDELPGAYRVENLVVVEVDADGRVAAQVMFDLDDIDAAFEELDARYLAGEAAAHARTWSAVAETHSTYNRYGRVPDDDWVSIDHRRGYPADKLTTTIRAARDLTPDLSIYIEAVHRLSDRAAVITNNSVGTSHEGFAAEWRMVQLMTVDGDRVTHLEIFDESDIDVALARFDELTGPAQSLNNAASQVIKRIRVLFAARDWSGMRENLAETFLLEDRRRTVNGGISHGRDTTILDLRAAVDVGFTDLAEDVVALRGERLVLTRARYSGNESRPEPYFAEVLHILRDRRGPETRCDHCFRPGRPRRRPRRARRPIRRR